MDRHGFVYILTNLHHTTLYTGVTADIKRRVWEHKTGAVKGFTKKYSCVKLVWFQHSDDLLACVEREKQIKQFSREKKETLISAKNPGWMDLSCMWYAWNV